MPFLPLNISGGGQPQSLKTPAMSSSAIIIIAAGCGVVLLLAFVACLWRQRQQRLQTRFLTGGDNMPSVSSDSAKAPKRLSSAHRVASFVDARANMLKQGSLGRSTPILNVQDDQFPAGSKRDCSWCGRGSEELGGRRAHFAAGTPNQGGASAARHLRA